MKLRQSLALLTALVFALVLAACGDSSTTGASAAPASGQRYTTTLAALNDSGVTGTVDFTVSGNQLTVHLKLNGVTATQAHAGHIHGATGKQASCPSIGQITNQGVVSLESGVPAYGPVALGLPTSIGSASGAVDLTKTLTLTTDEKAKITPLDQHVIVIHGMTFKGKFDGLLPAACGPVVAVK